MSDIKIAINVGDKRRYVKADGAENLLEVLRRNGYRIPADCGGAGKCGKCEIEISRGDGVFKKVLACKTLAEGVSDIRLNEEKGSGLLFFDTISPSDSKEKGFGIALDIGTTTLAFYLVDMFTGKVIDTLGSLNPQRVYGADVLSRIKYATEGRTHELHALIAQETKNVVEKLMRNNDVEKIKRLIVTGNNTMLHLFADVDPSSMGASPFTPVFTQTMRYNDGAFGISADEIILMPSVSAFVGSDVVSGGVAVDIKDGNNALIDMGTNGEMLLNINGALYCTSTAAGPALEGADITCGMGGVAGAIDSVKSAGGKISYTTIGNAPPRGICGTGLVDAISVMLDTGVIDETGAFVSGESFSISDKVFVSERDVRKFQLAKSAISAGFETLLNSAGVKPEQIDNVYISGGLGFYLNIENAVNTGLIPRKIKDKVRVSGNTAGKGAVMALTDKVMLNKAEDLCRTAHVVDLSQNSFFAEAFISNMYFL